MEASFSKAEPCPAKSVLKRMETSTLAGFGPTPPPPRPPYHHHYGPTPPPPTHQRQLPEKAAIRWGKKRDAIWSSAIMVHGGTLRRS
ncbi:hypothetical protein BDZ91DRAFT_712518 [Kalaharituber pfeilii]|nr:hypothetical protein BDZ91DRAFT_712518 [Kalaharituber pfeilii]